MNLSIVGLSLTLQKKIDNQNRGEIMCRKEKKKEQARHQGFEDNVISVFIYFLFKEEKAHKIKEKKKIEKN